MYCESATHGHSGFCHEVGGVRTERVASGYESRFFFDYEFQ